MTYHMATIFSPEVVRTESAARSYVDLFEWAAGIGSILAGGYLLQAHSLGTIAGGGQSWFQVLAHGIGGYIIARGVWMLAQIRRKAETLDRLDKLVELAALEHTKDAPAGRG